MGAAIFAPTCRRVHSVNLGLGCPEEACHRRHWQVCRAHHREILRLGALSVRTQRTCKLNLKLNSVSSVDLDPKRAACDVHA